MAEKGGVTLEEDAVNSKAECPESWEERRRFPRRVLSMDVHLGVESETRLSVKSLNISEGGLGISLQEPLAIDKSYDFTIFFEDSRKPIRARGKIVWQKQEVDSSYSAGVEFTEIGDEERDRIFMKVIFDAPTFL